MIEYSIAKQFALTGWKLMVLHYLLLIFNAQLQNSARVIFVNALCNV